MSWRDSVAALGRVFRERGRRAEAIAGRASIEYCEVPEGALEDFEAKLKRTIGILEGVEELGLNHYTRRVVVKYDPRFCELSDLVVRVEAAERDFGFGPIGASSPERTLPDDPEMELTRGLEAGAAAGGLALGLVFRFLPFIPKKTGAWTVAILGIVEGSERLRAPLDEALGRERADLVIGLAMAAAQATSQRPMNSAVDTTYAAARLRDEQARRRLWERRGREWLEDLPENPRPTHGFESPRPVPLPKGPVERARDLSFLVAPTAFAFSLATTRNVGRAGAALFAAFPKPARVGREVFSAELSRRLATRGTLVIDHEAFACLDRVDCLVLDGGLVSHGQFQMKSVVVDPSADELEAAGRAEALFDPDQPLERREAEGWSLMPLGLRADGLGDEIEASADALVSRGGLVLSLCRGDEIVALAEVQAKPQAGIDEVIKAAYAAGMRVVFAGVDRSQTEGLGADEVIEGGAAAGAGIRGLQREGHVVCFVSRGPSEGLPSADLGVGLWREGDAVPWGAHVVCPDDLAELRALIKSSEDAARASEHGARFALGAAAIGAFASAGGAKAAAAVPRVVFAANAMSFLSMANGVRHSMALEGYRTRQVDPTPWHALEAEAVMARLGVPSDGLTDGESLLRSDRPAARPPAIVELGRAIGQEMVNPLTPLLAAGAGLSALVGSRADAAIVATVGGINGLVGGAQRYRAERSIRELERDYSQRSRVRRGGLVTEIEANELVPGDLLVFDAGDVIPADCRLVDGDSVEVNAASLTGESLPVPKNSTPSFEHGIPDRSCMIYGGSTIAAGRGTAVVVATGRETEAQKAIIKEPGGARRGGVEARLEQLMGLTMPVAGAAAAAIITTGILRRRPMDELVATGVSLGVASVPEGLPLLATAAQLASARRLSERGVLVRNARSIEALGRVDVICMDKTGTLTEGRVELSMISDGDTLVALDELASTHRSVLVAAMRASIDPRASEAISDPLDQALRRGAARAGVERDSLSAPRERVSEQAFESGRGFHSVLTRTPDALMLEVKGSPEVVVEKCARRDRGDRETRLNRPLRQKLLDEATRLAQSGLRVLAVARSVSPSDAVPLEAARVHDLSFLGFIAFSDPVRASSAKAVSGLKDAGVRVMMLTGDHPSTAAAIATDVGLAGAYQVLVGADLDRLDDAELTERLESHSVYARVTPAQKTRIVRALQRKGHVVAMAGDGANDAPAMRLADVGLAVGRDCTPAARAVADVVLTDERIDNAVEAVIEGRGMWVSVRNAVSILLGGNLGEIGFTVGAGVLAGRPPLNPRQLLLVNFLTDIAPAIAIALRPPRPETLSALAKEGPDASLHAPLTREITSRAIVTGAGAGAAWFAGRMTGSRKRAGTIGLVSLVGTQLGQTLATGASRGVVITSVGSALALATVVQTPGLSQLFGCRPLGPMGWATATAASIAATRAAPMVQEIVDQAADTVEELIDR